MISKTGIQMNDLLSLFKQLDKTAKSAFYLAMTVIAAAQDNKKKDNKNDHPQSQNTDETP